MAASPVKEVKNINSLGRKDAGTIAEALEQLDAYEQKVKDGHTFTLEEVEKVKKLTERVRKATGRMKPNRATKKKRKKRK
jgi:hypothetical protein